MAGRVKRIANRIIASQRMDMSVTTSKSAVAQVKELWEPAMQARELAQYRQAWYDLELGQGGIRPDELPYMPEKAIGEMQKLKRLSPTPWGRMIVNEITQLLAVDDILLEDQAKSAPAYRIWQQNGLDGRQKPVIQAANIHGQSYNLILPAIGRYDRKPTALIRGKSALRMTAFYRDDFDEYPEFAIEVVEQPLNDGTSEWLISFYDDTYTHRMSTRDLSGEHITYIDNEPHGMGVCPVVRFADLDLEGRALGEITPYIPLFRRIDQDTCDRLIVQRYGAFVVRTIAGMDKPSTAEAQRAASIALGVGDLLVSPNDKTKFGSIPATPMDGYLKGRDSDIKDLAATSQTPSYRLLGLGDNIGADAIQAANESQDRKKADLQRVFGESWEASMRLAGHAMGDTTVATDFTSSVHWVPRNSESLQTLTQGLATAAVQLEIAPELLWDRLPDWNRTKTEQALTLREQRKQQALDEAVQQQLLAGALSGGSSGNDNTDQAGAGAPAGTGSAG